MNAEVGIEMAAQHAGEFAAATKTAISTADSGTQVMTVVSPRQLEALLADLMVALDGYDWADSDPDFLQQCIDADMDYTALIAMAVPQTPAQQIDRLRKQTGDLGEVVTVLYLLVHEGWRPAAIAAKNVLKLYEGVSEPGVDIIVVDLDPDDRSLRVENDRLHLVDVKASTRASMRSLAGTAADSIGSLDLHSFQRELRLLIASVQQRGGGHLIGRLRSFIWDFQRNTERIVRAAAIVAEEDVAEDCSYSELADVANRVIVESIPAKSLVSTVFAHRS